MKRIIKSKPPEEWEKLIKKNPGIQYRELDRIKHGKEARQILHSSLIEEQGGLCCYCSREIKDGSSHNEHLKSRTDYPEESMRYQNIVASCNSLTTCGKYKDRKSITVNYVSPLEEDCESNFSWDSSGNIFGENERAQKTIELLNLNESNLKNSRFTL
ncbi:retron system putative HNH endonuclease [Allobaculum sp. JKK-2023]|uniref:retron system putative HNH endonuclease n=1 Tax=Allobaculum sp. JKK-2023 TaxID=3108943 RepID=UPI002B053710|nr:retron system putative HNH endonuclease [Allobaculum sp. JKK-2023]